MSVAINQPDPGWLSRLPLITSLPPDEAAAKLREIGEDEMADGLAEESQDTEGTYTWVPKFGTGRRRTWTNQAHTIGYLAPVAGPASEPLPIRHAANILPDDTLKGARIKLTLDELRVADYPGRGKHHILFDFSACNQTEQGSEQLHFNAHYEVADGERGAVRGRPIFTGLQVGGEGIFLQCATVNVSNDDDEKLLRFLDGAAFQAGLQLVTTAQPALAPFSALAVGLTETIAKRSRNVPVQTVDLGLDFSQIAPQPRLLHRCADSRRAADRLGLGRMGL